jgi:hypothetical protein
MFWILIIENAEGIKSWTALLPLCVSVTEPHCRSSRMPILPLFPATILPCCHAAIFHAATTQHEAMLPWGHVSCCHAVICHGYCHTAMNTAMPESSHAAMVTRYHATMLVMLPWMPICSRIAMQSYALAALPACYVEVLPSCHHCRAVTTAPFFRRSSPNQWNSVGSSSSSSNM